MSQTITTRRTGRGLSALILPAFAGTLFLSAFLLFSVQPMFTKMVLPKLGGSAAVWSVAMVFFQAVLLAGYGLAHLLTTRLGLAKAIGVHLMVCLAAAVVLPIAVPASWGAPPERFTEVWLIGLFALTVGLPFFAVSVNGPLLQAWFARTGHAHASDPYFLYGASNLGSFLALLAYPVVIEPWIGAQAQARLWAGGFLVLAALIAALGAVTLKTAPAGAAREVRTKPEPIAARRALRWVFLAFVPSALLVAVTAHISTDVAAAPFLWVLPLSLFLATFVLVFRHRPLPPHGAMLAVQPFLMAAVVALTALPVLPLPARVALELAAFFVAAMVAHGELAADRPKPDNLTAFYLWMSLGGVLGGIFAGLLAPAIFTTIAEYPILLVAALACRPGLRRPSTADLRRALPWVAGAALLFALPVALHLPLGTLTDATLLALVALAVVLVVMARADDLRLAGTFAVTLFAAVGFAPGLAKVESVRSFYGVHRIAESADGQFRFLFHGTTIHGAERIRDVAGAPIDGRPRPATYYWSGGPLADVIAAARAAGGGRIARVAAIGLGTGSLACHARAGEAWTFYEIDPEVVRIARDPAKFRFLAACRPDQEIVVGDGRLTLARADRPAADLIVVDAFSSDSIPVHLLTREAIRLYRDRLGPHGLLAFHLTNRHMDLLPVAAALGTAEGLTVWSRVGHPDAAGEAEHDGTSAVAVMARDPADLATIAGDPAWRRMAPETQVAAWTDDHADVLAAILRRATGREPETH
ncbi:hypothetical protein EYW49_06245 [Siculibacillus lacustris]|uniref:Spermidine synthase n=1 Tax=Siculibacillus lacustris TaxID=1549641 RepID=A0A4Q9VTP9_9HYPH|nr:fused MFS/spermidine synthase [Siculibacillus lacustris]TBW39469.1 hypothetical protein EYW49_06245 [Siculibacillus lacustris]